MSTIEMPVKDVWEGNYHDYTDVARQGHFHIRARASLVTKHPNLGLLPKMGETKGKFLCPALLWTTVLGN